MDKKMIFIVISLLFFIVLITSFAIYKKKKKEKYKSIIEKLEYEKNQLVGVPILTELSKVRELVKTDILKEKLKEWDNTFKEIKENKIDGLTDLITETDFLIDRKEYDKALKNIALIEMNIEIIRSQTNELIEEIRVITKSEERNRNIVTKLKVSYREIENKFERNFKDYGPLQDNIKEKLSYIDKLFRKFETFMDRNDYIGVEEVVISLETEVKNMKVYIDETPYLVLMATVLIPGKIEELNTMYYRMTRDGYSLDYLNIEYNIKEIKTKVSEIVDNLIKFEIGDAHIELKTMLDYFNTLFSNFDKEREAKDLFKENIKKFKYKLDSINKIVYDIYIQIDDIKNTYDLSDDEINKFGVINKSLEKISEDYKTLYEHGKGRTFAYSKLVTELEGLTNKLNRLQDDLDYRLKSITSMKDDEYRAKEQYVMIQKLLLQAKAKLKEYKIPIIPNSYFIEFKEADEAIREIVKEINKKPIVIKILNIRVDTARDLVFKIYNNTNDMVKTVMLCERLIVYGNRYRSSYQEVDVNLDEATDLFNRGQYKKSLDILVSTLSEIDTSIKDRFEIN